MAALPRAPSSDFDSLIVVIPDFSLAFPHEVPASQWAHGSGLPALNAACLVLFDERGDAWVPLWDGLAANGAWTPLAYMTGTGTGGWADVADYEPAGYLLDSFGLAHIRGTCANLSTVGYPSTNVVIATLPAAACPRYAKRFVGAALDSSGHYIAPLLIAQTDGRIKLAGADVGQVPLGNTGNYQWLAFSTDFEVL